MQDSPSLSFGAGKAFTIKSILVPLLRRPRVAQVVKWIVYGSLIFVLLQFRPGKADSGDGEERARKLGGRSKSPEENRPEPHGDRLDALADIEHHDRLRSRYDRILAGTEKSPRKR